MSLQDELDSYKRISRQTLTSQDRQLFEDYVRELQGSSLGTSALRVGDTAPDFALSDHEGNCWELGAALRSGPVILEFYRGAWCPYCNLELQAYRRLLSEIRECRASFVAISPENPDFALELFNHEDVGFSVLRDVGNVVARRFGLQFTVPKHVQEAMERSGIYLEERTGLSNWTLPVPGTFVISQDRRILFGFAEPDYTQRADPVEVIRVVCNCAVAAGAGSIG